MHYFREVFTNFTLLKLFHPILKLSYDANECIFLWHDEGRAVKIDFNSSYDDPD